MKSHIFNSNLEIIMILTSKIGDVGALVNMYRAEKLGLIVFVLSLLLSCMTTHAQPTRLTDSPRHNLSPQTQLLIDPTGKLTVDAVAAMPDLQLQQLTSDLSLGFTDDVVWLKVVLSRLIDADPVNWYLVLGQTVLKDVRLYKPNQQGGYSEHFGTQPDGLDLREVLHRRPVFLIQQEDLGEQIYWLRIQTPTAMNTNISVIRKDIFLTETTGESFFWGLMFGGYLIAIIFYVAFWTWTRELIHKNYIAYITINFLAAFFTGGWPTQFSTQIPNTIWTGLLGIWIALSISTGTRFSCGFIELHQKNPQLNKYLHGTSYAMTIFGIMTIAAGQYKWVMPLLQSYTMVLISFLMIISIYHSFKNDQKSRFFIFAFSFFYLGVVGRYLRNIAFIEPNFWNENIYQLGAFVHMLVMSIGIFANYNKMRKDKQRAELRADAEARLREEQRDFLSLVSHEFRTPLTISGASADNLLQEPELSKEARGRVVKILNANQRMTSLMDNYLSKERLYMSTQNLKINNHQLNQLCRLAIADMPDAELMHVRLDCSQDIQIQCDAELIRIALNNLLQNAYRFSPAPGSIQVKCFVRQNKINIQVTDQGTGIPDAELKLIFSRYFRGKNSLNQPGAGLGLHLIQTIARRHGGDISVRNLENIGCEFCMVLPC